MLQERRFQRDSWPGVGSPKRHNYDLLAFGILPNYSVNCVEAQRRINDPIFRSSADFSTRIDRNGDTTVVWPGERKVLTHLFGIKRKRT